MTSLYINRHNMFLKAIGTCLPFEFPLSGPSCAPRENYTTQCNRKWNSYWKNVILLQWISLNAKHRVSLTLGHVYRAWERIYWLAHCSRNTEDYVLFTNLNFRYQWTGIIFLKSYPECSCICIFICLEKWLRKKILKGLHSVGTKMRSNIKIVTMIINMIKCFNEGKRNK